jgi:hypothetical protein
MRERVERPGGQITMGQNSLSFRYLTETVGIPIEIISNEYNEFHGNEHQKIVFQIQEDEPDLFAFGVLFTLSLMSFTYAAPRGYSENQFIPDEEWNLEYFLQGLEFEYGKLKYSGDYVSGRHMKTTIIFGPGGRVTLDTRNRGLGADRWMIQLQGKKHLQQL